ncbi:MAG TPA: LeuA family protein [Vicinamibacterales bacterium]|nr:LeuA family protein [Vicinamibacterales bacterium]
MRIAPHPLIYDWNHDAVADGPARPIAMLDDETLRDGLQSPSVRTPTIDEKIDILHHMDALGIDTADIGLPGAGPKVARDVERLARAIADGRMKIRANCAARTVVADIRPIAEIQQRTGVPIEVGAFIGSSPIRQYAEGWTLDFLQKATEDALTFAAKEGLEVMYVTEDTTRADPDSLRRLFTAAIRAGAKRLCVADTVGHATPNGATAVVRFVKSVIDELGADVGIDWHGHRDRGFGVASSIAALQAGATRVHGAALGIGERCGNTPIDLLMVNLVMMGYRDNDLTTLPAYAQAVANACDVRIAPNYPVIGADAFRTATGVHAAAVVKAFRKQDRALMDAVYAAVPASLVGRAQEIEVGPMSGRSNVIFWLESRGLPATDEIVDRVFAAAKASNRTLTHEQVQSLVGGEATLKPAGAKLHTARRKGF